MKSIKVVKPEYKIECLSIDALHTLERIGRVCYKSEERITHDSSTKFIENIIKRGHESVLEHCSMTVRFVCDRGVSHELVRHRHCSFSQESTRYVNYKDRPMRFILPCWFSKLGVGEYYVDAEAGTHPEYLWLDSCMKSSEDYNELIELGWSPQQARSVLPNSLKTEIVVTTNIRDWRHIFSLRCNVVTAHPQMRELMIPLHKEVSNIYPALFSNIDGLENV